MADDRERVEVLVIGAGAAGAAFTWSLSQAGIKVMCLEQGGWVDPKSYPHGAGRLGAIPSARLSS
jgi:choline dehydrogenase-like flavoprotein